MNVDDVVLSKTKNALEIFSQLESPGEAGLRSIRVYRLTFADANYVRLVAGAGNVRRDDVHLVAVASCLPRKEMHVFADAAEVRIVILRYQRDSERARVLHVRHWQRCGRHQLHVPARDTELTRQERHELRLAARLEL
jgi:hypothetical protein